MSLLTLIVGLVVVGVVLYAINRFVPMDARIKQLLNVVVILVLVAWLLYGLGVLGELDRIRFHC